MEHAELILQWKHVDAGFGSDTAVRLAEQSGRDECPRDPAVVDVGREGGDILYDTTADGHDVRRPSRLVRQQPVDEKAYAGESLAFFIGLHPIGRMLR